ISVGGNKVAPAQVEAAILELPEVAAAAVWGEQNALLGQVVVAKGELAPGTAAAGAERRSRQHCRGRLAAYQVPVRVAVVAGLALPRACDTAGTAAASGAVDP